MADSKLQNLIKKAALRGGCGWLQGWHSLIFLVLVSLLLAFVGLALVLFVLLGFVLFMFSLFFFRVLDTLLTMGVGRSFRMFQASAFRLAMAVALSEDIGSPQCDSESQNQRDSFLHSSPDGL